MLVLLISVERNNVYSVRNHLMYSLGIFLIKPYIAYKANQPRFEKTKTAAYVKAMQSKEEPENINEEEDSPHLWSVRF